MPVPSAAEQEAVRAVDHQAYMALCDLALFAGSRAPSDATAGTRAVASLICEEAPLKKRAEIASALEWAMLLHAKLSAIGLIRPQRRVRRRRRLAPSR